MFVEPSLEANARCVAISCRERQARRQGFSPTVFPNNVRIDELSLDDLDP